MSSKDHPKLISKFNFSQDLFPDVFFNIKLKSYFDRDDHRSLKPCFVFVALETKCKRIYRIEMYIHFFLK